MTTVDWIAVGVVALAAFLGLRKGLLAGLLGAAGVVGGAVLGARLAEHVLHNGHTSPYAPLIAVAGAISGGAVLASVGSMLGATLRKSLIVMPPLRALDAAGGLVLGAVAGFALVWVIGIAALHVPGQTRFRDEARKSDVFRRLLAIAPPADVLSFLQRVDTIPSLPDVPGLSATDPPQPGIVVAPPVKRARRSIVRILGSACGLDVQGTGWAVAPQYVVTAAHVVEGIELVTVVLPSGSHVVARAVIYDPASDLAVLRVVGARLRPLPITNPRVNQPIAVLGFPRNGALVAVPGRIGGTGSTTVDAGGRPARRSVTSVRVDVHPGDSGAPAIDAGGAVHATIVARSDSDAGVAYAIPSSLLRAKLAQAGPFVSTGSCSR